MFLIMLEETQTTQIIRSHHLSSRDIHSLTFELYHCSTSHSHTHTHRTALHSPHLTGQLSRKCWGGCPWCWERRVGPLWAVYEAFRCVSHRPLEAETLLTLGDASPGQEGSGTSSCGTPMGCRWHSSISPRFAMTLLMRRLREPPGRRSPSCQWCGVPQLQCPE